MPEAKKIGLKKSWYSVLAPEFLGGEAVAETLAAKPQDLIGRALIVPLNEITENIKHHQIEMHLKIYDVVGDKAKTQYNGQELARDAITRLIRRWSSRIDIVQGFTTSDGKKLRLKSIVISARRINTSLQSSIRKEVIAITQNWTKGKTLEGVVLNIITGKYQHEIGGKIRKIYPIRAVEIRKINLLK